MGAIFLNLISAAVPVMADAALKGAVLLAAAAVAAIALRRASAAMRHLVWTLAIFGLLALPVLSAILPQWRVLPQWPAVSYVDGPVVSDAERPAVSSAEEPAPSSQGKEPFQLEGHAQSWPEVRNNVDATERVPPVLSQDVGDTEAAAAPVPLQVPEVAANNNSPASAKPHRPWRDYLLGLWIFGAALALFPAVVGQLALRRLSRSARPIEEHSWIELIQRLSQRMGLRRKIVLLRSDRPVMPMAWGLCRARIMLPGESDNWSAERRRVVLLHEMAHIYRRDCLTQFLTNLACAIHWFNPLVWIARRQMIAERERACDDLVLGAGFEANDYAQELLRMASGLRAGILASGAAIAMARQSKLEGRLLAILDAKRNRRALTRKLTLFLLLTTLIFVFPLACIRERRLPISFKATNSPDNDEPTTIVDGLQLCIRPVVAPGKEPIFGVAEDPSFLVEFTNTSDTSFRLFGCRWPQSVTCEIHDLFTGTVYTPIFIPNLNLDDKKWYSANIAPGQVTFTGIVLGEDYRFKFKVNDEASIKQRRRLPPSEYVMVAKWSFVEESGREDGPPCWTGTIVSQPVPFRLVDTLTPEEANVEILESVQTTLMPQPGTRYVIAGPYLYRPVERAPAAYPASRSWHMANEFVFRTALRNRYSLPAVAAVGEMVEFAAKDGQVNLNVRVNIKDRTASIEKDASSENSSTTAEEIDPFAPVPLEVVRKVPYLFKNVKPDMTHNEVLRQLGLWDYRKRFRFVNGFGVDEWSWETWPLREGYDLLLTYYMSREPKLDFEDIWPKSYLSELRLQGKGWDADGFVVASAGLQFRLVDDSSEKTGRPVMNFGTGQLVYVEPNVLLGRQDMQSAVAEQDRQGQWSVHVTFTPEGAAKFAQVTKENIGRELAILFGGQVVSAPKIMSTITGGTGIIIVGGKNARGDAQRIVDSIGRAMGASAKEPSEQPWGDAVEGVQVRLKSPKLSWQAGETPFLEADLRNTGEKTFYFAPSESAANPDLEFDGTIYHWVGPAEGLLTSDFAPTDSFNDITITVGRGEVFGETEGLELWATENGVPLEVTPGKHTVRVTFPIRRAEKSGGGVIHVTSNPVEIRIEPKTESRNTFRTLHALPAHISNENRLAADGTAPSMPETMVIHYTVKRGDNLWLIAKQYLNDGEKWRTIARENEINMNDPQLKVGQVLKITLLEPLPELVDKEEPMINGPPDPIHLKGVYFANGGAINTLVRLESPETRDELSKRLFDEKRSMPVRLLYAAILASQDDKDAQDFLIKRANEVTEYNDVRDVFWAMGNLDWFLPRKSLAKNHVNMEWAKDFVLALLSDGGTVKFAPMNTQLEMRAVALLHDTGFAYAIARIQDDRLFPLLVEFYKKNMTYMDCSGILRAIAQMKNEKVKPFFLDMLRLGSENERRIAASALAELKSEEALPLLLESLSRGVFYSALGQYKDERILPALKNALPNLKDFDQGDAQMLIIDLEGGDRLPKLIECAKNPDFHSLRNPMTAIRDLRDERALEFAANELSTSPDLHCRTDAIGILAELKSPGAVKALIDALDVDYQALATSKDVMADNNKRWRGEILEHLKNMTGQDFGVDKTKWLNWYTEAYK